jgi:4-aminobutyrate aminotransferase-like enzyme/Ser/Thr protein kinase RdoA (MazF antagonist)
MTIPGTSAPRFDRGAALRIARERWGIDGATDPLPSERDQNFRIAGTGGTFVLKISQAGESRALLDFQNALLERLTLATEQARPHDPMRRFSFGSCVESATGARIETVVDDAGTQHFARILTFVPGTPLATVQPQDAALLRDVGRLVGAVARALDGWDHPAAHRVLHWDLRYAPVVIARHLPAIAPDRRALMEHFLHRIRARYTDLASLPTAIIHGDANDWNVLVRAASSGNPVAPSPGPQPAAVDNSSFLATGLIDAGDVVHSWRVGDLAIACAYAMLGTHDPIGAAQTIVSGYTEVFSASADEIDALFPLICARLCMSVVLSAYQRSVRPDNAYLSISEAPAWKLLERLRGVAAEDTRAMFRAAAEAGSSQGETPASVRDDLLVRRAASIGPSLSIAYRSPLVIVRGRGQFLYDENGRAYLDAVNNVSHVGHSHPRVVEAMASQARELNTNTRYLHELLVRYAERLTATLPDPLRVCWFTCSGSEANELALRLARTHTGRQDVIVLDAAYHGNTTSLIDMSPYKFKGPGGHPPPPWVHVAPLPDPYRGKHRGTGPEQGTAYAAEVRDLVQHMKRQNRPPAAFFAEPLPGCGGQIVPPESFLQQAFAAVREAGGVCVADEVQTGLGRVGSHFWAFETQDAVPDIVTIGKPIGNGFPLGAVVTTREIADSFDNGMEYFNTFGGNPVACAAGLAVLDVIAEEGLQANALHTGAQLLAQLRALMDRHAVLGDARGLGLYIGVELVRSRKAREPAGSHASHIVNAMRERGILLSTDGPDHNVLKIKPPLVFGLADAERLAGTLDEVLMTAF